MLVAEKIIYILKKIKTNVYTFQKRNQNTCLRIHVNLQLD